MSSKIQGGDVVEMQGDEMTRYVEDLLINTTLNI